MRIVATILAMLANGYSVEEIAALVGLKAEDLRPFLITQEATHGP